MGTPDFSGRTVLVTGASAGVGQASARAFAAAGAHVVCAARGHERLAAVAAEVGGTAIVADVSHPEDCRRLVEETLAAGGGLDVLVNNAGCHHRGPVAQRSAEELGAMVDANLRAPIVLTRLALDALRLAGRRGGQRRLHRRPDAAGRQCDLFRDQVRPAGVHPRPGRRARRHRRARQRSLAGADRHRFHPRRHRRGLGHHLLADDEHARADRRSHPVRPPTAGSTAGPSRRDDRRLSARRCRDSCVRCSPHAGGVRRHATGAPARSLGKNTDLRASPTARRVASQLQRQGIAWVSSRGSSSG